MIATRNVDIDDKGDEKVEVELPKASEGEWEKLGWKYDLSQMVPCQDGEWQWKILEFGNFLIWSTFSYLSVYKINGGAVLRDTRGVKKYSGSRREVHETGRDGKMIYNEGEVE